MGIFRELVDVGIAQAVAWPAAWVVVHTVRNLTGYLELRMILRRIPDDQILPVIRALNASRHSAK